METTAAIIAGSVLTVASSVGGAMHAQNMQKKSQRSAEIAAREAAKRNVTVKASGSEPVQESTENVEAGEAARQSAAKRRQGIAGTLTGRGLTSGLLGNKSILGG